MHPLNARCLVGIRNIQADSGLVVFSSIYALSIVFAKKDSSTSGDLSVNNGISTFSSQTSTMRPTPSSQPSNQFSVLPPLLTYAHVAPTYPPPYQPHSTHQLFSSNLKPFKSTHLFPFPLLAILLRTSTIIEIPNLTTVENFLFQALINLIVYMASPGRGAGAGRNLGRKLGKDGTEMGGAFAAAGGGEVLVIH